MLAQSSGSNAPQPGTGLVSESLLLANASLISVQRTRYCELRSGHHCRCRCPWHSELHMARTSPSAPFLHKRHCCVQGLVPAPHDLLRRQHTMDIIEKAIAGQYVSVRLRGKRQESIAADCELEVCCDATTAHHWQSGKCKLHGHECTIALHGW